MCIGTVVLLLRIPRIPAWDSLYAEDQGVYLFDALAHPWHLLVPYGGYEELVPRLVGQLISYLPLADVAVPFAVTGPASPRCARCLSTTPWTGGSSPPGCGRWSARP